MRLFLPLLCLLAACAPVAVPANADFSGKVVGVSDGDTLTVLRGRETVRVRWGNAHGALVSFLRASWCAAIATLSGSCCLSSTPA